MPLPLYQTVTQSSRDRGLCLVARLRTLVGRRGSIAQLLSLLLVFQIVTIGAPGHQDVRAPVSDLAGLSAALGQPVALCHHGDTGLPTPALPGDCGHCVLCAFLTGGAILPTGTIVRTPIPAFAALRRSGQTDPALKTRYAGGPGPRGPPRLA